MAFIFDATKGETPEDIRRKRDLVRALMGASRAPQNVGEGLNALGDGIVAAVLNSRANKAEQAGLASAADAFGTLFPSTDFPAAPAQPSSIGPAAGSPAGGSRAASEIQQPAPDIPADVAGLESYIRQAAQKRGIDPDIAVRVARSEGLAPGVWQSNVVKGGRRETSYGPFQLLVGGGLGDKFMKLYGKSPADRSTVLQQIDFALDEAATGGWSPWYGAAKVGVGPRTGLDNARPLGMQAAAAVAAPVQVASLDPSAGMAAAAAPAADTMQPGQPVTQTAAGNRILRALLTPGPMADQAAPMTLGAPEPQPVQVAQAQPQVIPPMAGGPAPQMSQGPSPTVRQLMEAAQNPWLNDGQRAIVNMLLEQELQKQDPRYQLETENIRGQIEDRRLDNQREDQRFGFEQDKFKTESQLAREKFEWEKGKPTQDIQEYEYYANQERQAGRQPLGPLEWDIARRRAGATNVTTNVGGEQLTPGQKKIDEAFADTYLSWQGGGYADAAKQLTQLNESLGILESAAAEGRDITGMIGVLPQAVQPFINPQGTIAREGVEEVVQRSLREILGAQFTEKEGERLIARAFNPVLKPAENAKRVRRLIGQVQGMAEARQEMVDYFDEHGTLRGYKGRRPSLSTLENIESEWEREDNRAGRAMPERAGAPQGVDPQDWEFMTPEERALFQ